MCCLITAYVNIELDCQFQTFLTRISMLFTTTGKCSWLLLKFILYTSCHG